jgi:hypothetical protein
MSRAPGIIPKRQGSFESWDGLVFDNQDHANALSGLFLARENNPYPHVDINLAQNNRMMDICPNQYVSLSVLAADNPRGIVWTDKKLIVRRVEIQHNAGVGSLMSVLECEADTDGPAGVTFIPPQPVEENIDPGTGPGDFPVFPEPNIEFPPYVPQPPPANDSCLEHGSGGYNIYWSPINIISSETESKRVSKAYFKCNIRDTGSFPTILRVKGMFYAYNSQLNIWEVENSNNSWYTLDAIDSGGGVVATAGGVSQVNVDVRQFTFSVGGNANIWGFRITIDEGEESGYSINNLITSGTVNGTAESGTTITSDATPGALYCVISSGGPVDFRTDPNYPNDISYIGAVDFGYGWASMGGYVYDARNSIFGYQPASGSFKYSYQVGNYSVVFFKPASSTIKFRFQDLAYQDNSGTLGYSLYNASQGAGFKINGLQGIVYNVCPVS